MIISLPPVFLIWQVRLREGEWLALGHTARKRQSCNVNPGLPVVVVRSGVITGLGGRLRGSHPREERGSGVWYSQKVVLVEVLSSLNLKHIQLGPWTGAHERR